MWPLPKLCDELVTITISPQSISCSWITRNQSSTPFVLQAYQRFACERLECERSVLFNPTYTKNCISSFLKQHSLENAFVSLAIVGPGVVESVVELTSPSAVADDFKFPKLKKLVWEYRYLYPNDDGRFAYYVGGITRPLLFQYQLLAMSLPCNLIAVTTERIALLRLYEHTYGAAFRRSQLALEMKRHNQDFHELFSTDTLRRLLSIQPTLSCAQEQPWLLTSLGLYISGKDV